eukprot:TRINITY_DN7269_c0_g1_i2.p1 TRINITY_DN7269_c0_g1~~TRINITY_DN7269_c0_g1_i2.p1  ORF type:complete len:554 (-),score=105.18 TRINITY_DN7269_c0_g1_i2:2695-4356(-)
MSESHLQKKLRELGLSAEGGTTGKKCTFKLFFPRPPHEGVEYKAAKCAEGYNFVGLVLGHGGSTLQKVQKATGAKIEIHDQTGNLNGSHPDLLDPSVHAYIITDTPGKLEKASRMIADTLQPVNGKFQPFVIKPGGAATLTPIKPKSSIKKSNSQTVSLLGDAPKPSLQQFILNGLATSKSDSGSSDESGTVTQTADTPQDQLNSNVWSSGQQHSFLQKSQELSQQDDVEEEEVQNIWGDVGGVEQSVEEQQVVLQYQEVVVEGVSSTTLAQSASNADMFTQQSQDSSGAVENGGVGMRDQPYLNGEQTSNLNSDSDLEGDDSGWSSWKDNQHQFFAVLQNELQNTLDNVTQNAERFNGLPTGGPFPQYTGKNKVIHTRANSDGGLSLISSSASSQRYVFPLHSSTFPQASFPSRTTASNNTNEQQQRLLIQQNNRHANGYHSSPLFPQNRASSGMMEFEKNRSLINSSMGMESSKFFNGDSGKQQVKVNGVGSGSLLSSKLASVSASSGQLQQSPQQLQQLQLQQQHHQQQTSQNIHNQQTVPPEHFAFLQH